MRVKTGRCRMPIGACSEFRDKECGKFCYYNTVEVKTHFDQIREKSVEEMAEFMTQTGTEYSCPPPHYFGETGFCRNENVVMSCRMCWIDWLKQGGEL